MLVFRKILRTHSMNNPSVANSSYKQIISPLDQFNQMFQEKYYNWYSKMVKERKAIITTFWRGVTFHSLLATR